MNTSSERNSASYEMKGDKKLLKIYAAVYTCKSINRPPFINTLTTTADFALVICYVDIMFHVYTLIAELVKHM